MDDWGSPWADPPGDPVALPSGHGLHDNDSLSAGFGPSFGSKSVWQTELGDSDWGDFGREDTGGAIHSVVASKDASVPEAAGLDDQIAISSRSDAILNPEPSWEPIDESFPLPTVAPIKLDAAETSLTEQDFEDDAQPAVPGIKPISNLDAPQSLSVQPSVAVDVHEGTSRPSTKQRLIEDQVSKMNLKQLDILLGEPAEDTPSIPEDDPISSVEARKIWYRISRSGTLLKHNGGDEDYIRVTWAKSRIREQVTKTVTAWHERGSFDRRRSIAAESRFGAMFGWGPKTDSEPSTPGQSTNKGLQSANMPASQPTPPITPVSATPRPFSIVATPSSKLIAPVSRPSTSTSDTGSAIASSIAPSRSAYSQDSGQSRRSSQTSLWSSPVVATAEKSRLSHNEEDDSWGDFADVEVTETNKRDWNWVDVTSNVDKHAHIVDTFDNFPGSSATPESIPEAKSVLHAEPAIHMPPTPQSISGTIPPILPSTDTSPSTTVTDFLRFVKSLPNLDYMSR